MRLFNRLIGIGRRKTPNEAHDRALAHEQPAPVRAQAAPRGQPTAPVRRLRELVATPTPALPQRCEPALRAALLLANGQVRELIGVLSRIDSADQDADIGKAHVIVERLVAGIPAMVLQACLNDNLAQMDEPRLAALQDGISRVPQWVPRELTLVHAMESKTRTEVARRIFERAMQRQGDDQVHAIVGGLTHGRFMAFREYLDLHPDAGAPHRRANVIRLAVEERTEDTKLHLRTQWASTARAEFLESADTLARCAPEADVRAFATALFKVGASFELHKNLSAKAGRSIDDDVQARKVEEVAPNLRQQLVPESFPFGPLNVHELKALRTAITRLRVADEHPKFLAALQEQIASKTPVKRSPGSPRDEGLSDRLAAQQGEDSDEGGYAFSTHAFDAAACDISEAGAAGEQERDREPYFEKLQAFVHQAEIARARKDNARARRLKGQ